VPLAALGVEPQPAERTVPRGSVSARTKSTRVWNFGSSGILVGLTCTYIVGSSSSPPQWK
jgi:hypothetical protein